LAVKAVLFDMGYTLIEYDSEPEEIFRRVLDSMGFSTPIGEVKEAFSQTEQECRNLHSNYLLGGIPSKDYWVRWNSAVLKHLRLPHDEKLGKQIQDRWFDCFEWNAYPDVQPTLNRLRRRGMKTGLVTTAYEEEIDIILRGASLPREHFDVVIGADTLKCIKPHPGVFKHALMELQVQPEEALFVGDLLEVDYRPAEKAGMTAILIHRKEGIGRMEEGLRIIRGLEGVLEYIDSLPLQVRN